MQLKELSLSVGLPLYEVIGKKIYLTDTGKELAHTARQMLGDWAHFSQTIDQAKGLSRGHLRVAVVSTAKYFIPRMLGAFCQTHQDMRSQVHWEPFFRRLEMHLKNVLKRELTFRAF